MIIHLDADAFYASCEQAADPRLRGQIMAVGGLRRGIIASASYEARALGIYTPMPTSRALRLCPGLKIVRSRFDRYEWFSRTMFGMLEDVTPTVERTSIDEGYFRLPDSSVTAAVDAASRLQQEILRRLQIPVSFGIATSKLVSQIASKLKKPRALAIVPPGTEAEFLAPLDIKWLPGVGGKTEQMLKAAGFNRICDVVASDENELTSVVGGLAAGLKRHACGEDDRPLVIDRGDSLSYSHQETFGQNITDHRFIERTLKTLLDDLARKLVKDGKSARTIAIRVRSLRMQDTERSESLPEPSSLAEDFHPLLTSLLDRAWDRKTPIRLAAVRLSNIHEGIIAGDLFTREDKGRRLALQQTINDLQLRFGTCAIMRGHAWRLEEPESRRH